MASIRLPPRPNPFKIDERLEEQERRSEEAHKAAIEAIRKSQAKPGLYDRFEVEDIVNTGLLPKTWRDIDEPDRIVPTVTLGELAGDEPPASQPQAHPVAIAARARQLKGDNPTPLRSDLVDAIMASDVKQAEPYFTRDLEQGAAPQAQSADPFASFDPIADVPRTVSETRAMQLQEESPDADLMELMRKDASPEGRRVGYGDTAKMSFAKDDDQAVRYLARHLYPHEPAEQGAKRFFKWGDMFYHVGDNGQVYYAYPPGLMGEAAASAGHALPRLCAAGGTALGTAVGSALGGPPGAIAGAVTGNALGSVQCEAMRQRGGDVMLRDPNAPQRTTRLDPEDPNRYEPIWDTPLNYDELGYKLVSGLIGVPLSRLPSIFRLLGRLPSQLSRPTPRPGRPSKKTQGPRN